MADSNELPKGTENPLAVTTLVIKNRLGGGTHIQQKDAKGKWLKKVKPLIPTVEFTRQERKALSKVRADGMTEYMKAFMCLLQMAQYEPNDDDKEDSKKRMAAVQAFKELRLSALGKPAPSEVEMDKLTTQPVKVVIINSPELMHPEVIQEKKQEVLKPSFAEVLEVQTNK
jgi:hypothetical protein